MLVGNDKMIHVFDKKGTYDFCFFQLILGKQRRSTQTPIQVCFRSFSECKLWDVYSDGEKLVDEVKTSERLLCSTSVKVNKD